MVVRIFASKVAQKCNEQLAAMQSNNLGLLRNKSDELQPKQVSRIIDIASDAFESRQVLQESLKSKLKTPSVINQKEFKEATSMLIGTLIADGITETKFTTSKLSNTLHNKPSTIGSGKGRGK